MNKKQIYNIVLFLTLTLFVIVLLYFANDYVGKVKGVSEQQKNTAEIIFLDVGQGDAILIQEGWTQILIDGGNGQEIMNRLGEFMPMGDRKIEFMIATHPDEDHLGGLIKVLSFYEVEEILESGIACDKDLCKKWEELISTDNISVVDAKLGQEINFGADTDIEVLYPFEDMTGKELENSNEASLVLKASVAGREYLLTGDTEADTEKALVASNLNLDADVLKVSHHGSKNATSAEFLQAVSPEQAVISVGENSYGHPTEEALNRLRNMNIEILRTDEMGSVRF
jgi:competence protein ComEC